MNKEMEEAIERLNGIDIKFFLSGNMEQSNYIIETADKVNKAIEIILKELKDSTPNSAIRKKKEKLEKEYKQALEKNSTKAFILKCQIEILEEILKEGEK